MKKRLGAVIGFFVGIIPAYFSFAITLALAEEGNFHPVALLIPVLVLAFFSFLGMIIERIITKIIK